MSTHRIHGKNDLTPILRNRIVRRFGDNELVSTLKSKWNVLAYSTALITDKQTLALIRGQNTITLETYALEWWKRRTFSSEPYPFHLNDQYSDVGIAVPSTIVNSESVNDSVFPHSGFHMGQEFIATSGHAYTRDQLEKLRFVFGAIWNADSTSFYLDKSPVYGVDLDFTTEHFNRGRLELDNSDVVIYKMKIIEARGDYILPGAPLFEENPGENICISALSHPLGLPQLTIGYEKLETCGHDEVCVADFVADLDIFSGSSGSPVIGVYENDLRIVGIVGGQINNIPFKLDPDDNNALVLNDWRPGSTDSEPVGFIVGMNTILNELRRRNVVVK